MCTAARCAPWSSLEHSEPTVSRSEDVIIVRAELLELGEHKLADLLAPILIASRHLANTERGWLDYLRSGENTSSAYQLARRLDEMDLLT